MPNYGKFSDNPQTEWLADATRPDRDMILLREFWYEDPDGRRWTAPQGARIDGASIPRPLWTVVGSPYTDDYRCASIVHDVACDDPAIPRRDADRMFYFACLAGGCSKTQARLLYLGVRLGDWATGAHKLTLPSRTQRLFRVPTARKTPAERELLDRFTTVARKLKTLDDAAGFDTLEALVEAELQ